MTDQEMIELAAVKVMGWHLDNHPELHGTGQWFCEYAYQQWFNAEGVMVANQDWNPVVEDNDAMKLWDKFSEGRDTRLDHYKAGLGLPQAHWAARVTNPEDATIIHECISPDRKRAQLECICKAVA